MKTEKPRTFGTSNQNGRQIRKLHSSKERSLLEKLRNRTHLSFQNRKRKEHSNTKPLLLFIKSEKPKITLSYFYKFQSKPKYSLHHCKTEIPHHAYHRSVHISKQEQDESMFLVLTLVMFFVLSCDKDTFLVHDIPLRVTRDFLRFLK